MSEFKLHLAIKKHYESCFIGAHNPNLKIFHIANESRDAAQGYWNKQLGILVGMPDLMAGWPQGKTGICEIKLPGKPLSSAQNKVLSWGKHIGWYTGIVRNVRDAHLVFRSWGLIACRLYSPKEEPDYATTEEKFRRGEDFYRP